MGVVERNGADGVDGGLACVSQFWAGSHTTRQGWPNPAWPGLAWPRVAWPALHHHASVCEAWWWSAVWGCRGSGGPRQRCSMVTCLRSAWHRFTQNLCGCVSLEEVPTLCLVAFRDGAAEAGHAETLKRESWREMWPIFYILQHKSGIRKHCVYANRTTCLLKVTFWVFFICTVFSLLWSRITF